MSMVDGTHFSPVVGPGTSPAEAPANPNAAPDPATDESSAASVPSPGNSSGLLQNFVLPKSTLDALGLLKPSNQGDTEVLVSQAYLTAELLADESEASEATALGFLAAANSSIAAADQARLAALEEQNAIDQNTISQNETRLASISGQIGSANSELTEFETQREQLTAQIAALDANDPDNAEQLAALERQLSNVNSQITSLEQTLGGLEAEQERLNSEIAQLRDDIIGRQQTINQQQVLLSLRESFLDKLVAATDGINQTVEEEQEETVTQEAEVILEEVLPNLQLIFETDLEDVALEEIIGDIKLQDRETQEAVALSVGIVGSFFESLGVFFQLANLIELDLDTAAFGNNKTQRLQISM